MSAETRCPECGEAVPSGERCCGVRRLRSYTAPPPLQPTHPGTWWRTYQNFRGVWSWMPFEVFDWNDGKGLRTGQGPISDTPECCKWGGEAVPPTLDPNP